MNGAGRNMNPPAGWTLVPGSDQFNTTAARSHAWWRLAGSNEPAGYTFTQTGGNGYDMSGGILDITGASQTAPINASAGQNSGTTSSASVTAPSITTTVQNTLLVYGGACNVNLTFLPPAAMTEWWDVFSSGTYKVTTETAVAPFVGPGVTGTRTGTVSGSCKNDGVLMAISP
jgi:hypothetical protein